jgi:hypothetical protein
MVATAELDLTDICTRQTFCLQARSCVEQDAKTLIRQVGQSLPQELVEFGVRLQSLETSPAARHGLAIHQIGLRVLGWFLDEFDITAIIGTCRSLAAVALSAELQDVAVAARLAQLNRKANLLQAEFGRLAEQAKTLGPEYKENWSVSSTGAAIAGDAWARCVSTQVDMYVSWSGGHAAFEKAAQLKRHSVCPSDTYSSDVLVAAAVRILRETHEWMCRYRETLAVHHPCFISLRVSHARVLAAQGRTQEALRITRETFEDAVAELEKPPDEWYQPGVLEMLRLRDLQQRLTKIVDWQHS